MIALIFLAQVATTTPVPKPTAVPPMISQGLAGAAGKIKVKKVDFSDIKTRPSPSKVAMPRPPGRPGDLAIAEEVLKKRLKAPSSYKRIASREVWIRDGEERRFRIEYDAQNSFGALLRGCDYVAPELDGAITPCELGDGLGWDK